MVFIVAASSLNYALETLTTEEKEHFKNKIYTIPGLYIQSLENSISHFRHVLGQTKS